MTAYVLGGDLEASWCERWWLRGRLEYLELVEECVRVFECGRPKPFWSWWCPLVCPFETDALGTRGVAVSLEDEEDEEERWVRDDRPEEIAAGRWPRGVAGTMVCVEVVESDEDEDEDDEGAGEYERGDVGAGDASTAEDGLNGLREAIVSLYSLFRDDFRCYEFG